MAMKSWVIEQQSCKEKLISGMQHQSELGTVLRLKDNMVLTGAHPR